MKHVQALLAAASALVIAAVLFFGWYEQEAPALRLASAPQAVPSARIFAAGDIMLDRAIRLASEAHGADWPFSCVDSLISSADFAVANLEGPITDFDSMSEGSIPGTTANYYFTFASTSAAVLARHHLGAVDIGNNHILNFEYSGMQQTEQYLRAAGVGYFGGVAGDENVFETTVNGVPLAFIGYNQFGGSKPEVVAQRVAQEAHTGRRVIVYTHWGQEYVTDQPALHDTAALFASAGAAAVIGSHPHVVLPHEYIGDTLVYYSLGNFIFDQWWNSDVTHGLTLMLTVPKEGRVTAVETPVELLRDGRTCPVAASATVQE
jgi:poly-gamma-glutamate synthesis protein (capsule biosynthesis protein)